MATVVAAAVTSTAGRRKQTRVLNSVKWRDKSFERQGRRCWVRVCVYNVDNDVTIIIIMVNLVFGGYFITGSSTTSIFRLNAAV